MRECFVERRFTGSSLRIIEQAVTIIAEMEAEGYNLTLRQLYYQFVTKNWLKNTFQNYKRLGSIINDARLAGMIDWDSITDITRYLRRIPDWTSPANFIAKQGPNYAEDLWRDQDQYCEVWIEKDALLGVIQRPCDKWRVPYFSCRGYVSQSELYEAGKRLKFETEQREYDHRPVTVIHLSDHDPSGLDMTEDLQKRLDMFCGEGVINVERVALTYEQIKAYGPPPNPVKETDSRHIGYAERYGDESWELDSLRPSVIDGLVEAAILDKLGNRELFEEQMGAEARNRAALLTVGKHFNAAHRFISQGNRVIE